MLTLMAQSASQSCMTAFYNGIALCPGTIRTYISVQAAYYTLPCCQLATTKAILQEMTHHFTSECRSCHFEMLGMTSDFIFVLYVMLERSACLLACLIFTMCSIAHSFLQRPIAHVLPPPPCPPLPSLFCFHVMFMHGSNMIKNNKLQETICNREGLNARHIVVCLKQLYSDSMLACKHITCAAGDAFIQRCASRLGSDPSFCECQPLCQGLR